MRYIRIAKKRSSGRASHEYMTTYTSQFIMPCRAPIVNNYPEETTKKTIDLITPSR